MARLMRELINEIRVETLEEPSPRCRIVTWAPHGGQLQVVRRPDHSMLVDRRDDPLVLESD